MGATSSAYYSAERRRNPAGRTSSQRGARVTRLHASRKRIGPGTKRRATRITFRLSAPTRVVFVVRGPAPSCEVVGRFTVRGHRGENRIRFTGRVGRTMLGPGTYRVTARPAGRPREAHRVVLIIGNGPREQLNCSSVFSFAFLGTAAFFGEGGGSAAAASTKASNAGGVAARTTKTEKGNESGGVLPAIKKKVLELPEALPKLPLPRDVADSPPAILGILALGLLALSGLAILLYIFRFLREPDTKSA
jgi:hypothetical protein